MVQLPELHPNGWHKASSDWRRTSVVKRFSGVPRVPVPGRATDSVRKRRGRRRRRRRRGRRREARGGKGVEKVGRGQRRGVLSALPLASLSLDTPFSGSPTPGGGPWFPFSPHRDTDKVTHPEKGQSVDRSATRSSRNFVR